MVPSANVGLSGALFGLARLLQTTSFHFRSYEELFQVRRKSLKPREEFKILNLIQQKELEIFIEKKELCWDSPFLLTGPIWTVPLLPLVTFPDLDCPLVTFPDSDHF